MQQDGERLIVDREGDPDELYDVVRDALVVSGVGLAGSRIGRSLEDVFLEVDQ